MGKCAKCGKEVDPAWALCPFCGESLKKSCPKCGKEVDPAWALCPFCGEKLKGGAKPEPKAEKFKFEFSEDTAELSEAFDKQIKESEQPPKGILSKEKASDLFAEYTKDSLRKAFASIKYYAESGDAEFQNYYACYYDSAVSDNQDVVKASDETAFYWYKKSAEQGFANAQYYLGNMYYSGIGCTQNKSEGLFWLKKAAQQGEVMAQFDLERLNIKW